MYGHRTGHERSAQGDGVEVRSVAALNTYDVLAARHVVMSEEAAARLEEKLGK